MFGGVEGALAGVSVLQIAQECGQFVGTAGFASTYVCNPISGEVSDGIFAAALATQEPGKSECHVTLSMWMILTFFSASMVMMSARSVVSVKFHATPL